MGLAGHRYHMVVLLLSLGCMPSAVLVKDPDLLKIDTCAIGLTLLFPSFMTRGPRKADPCGLSGLLSAPTLLGLLGKASKTGRHLCLDCKREGGLGA